MSIKLENAREYSQTNSSLLSVELATTRYLRGCQSSWVCHGIVLNGGIGYCYRFSCYCGYATMATAVSAGPSCLDTQQYCSALITPMASSTTELRHNERYPVTATCNSAANKRKQLFQGICYAPLFTLQLQTSISHLLVAQTAHSLAQYRKHASGN